MSAAVDSVLGEELIVLRSGDFPTMSAETARIVRTVLVPFFWPERVGRSYVSGSSGCVR